ncbi:hypothetical protein V6N12_006703 [Hibiscus sabdariffa]|uniref:Uncharacterized protein n=1 Tax=Hibiscus sabdariffa TaxID=183260 RepID=A0ABR2EZK0_9ROSI
MSFTIMALQRWEICVEMVKLVIEFVIDVAEAFWIVTRQSDSDHSVVTMMRSPSFADSSLLFLGFLLP